MGGADAVPAGGVDCSYSPVLPATKVLAESAGLCDAGDYVVHIYVYATEAERQARLASASAYWCKHGRTSGSWVAAHRWVVALELPSGADPDTVDIPDLAGATGGDRVPLQCDQDPASVALA